MQYDNDIFCVTRRALWLDVLKMNINMINFIVGNTCRWQPWFYKQGIFIYHLVAAPHLTSTVCMLLLIISYLTINSVSSLKFFFSIISLKYNYLQ